MHHLSTDQNVGQITDHIVCCRYTIKRLLTLNVRYLVSGWYYLVMLVVWLMSRKLRIIFIIFCVSSLLGCGGSTVDPRSVEPLSFSVRLGIIPPL